VPDSDITVLLRAASDGQPEATERLFAAVYERLRRLARRQLGDERPDHTLAPTELVHEAFLKLVDTRSITWENQAHFFRVAAQAMRRILVDHARRRRAGKRSRHLAVTLDPEILDLATDPDREIVVVDDALERLGQEDPRAVKLVELRYFAGLSIEESARVLGVSPATARREWTFARGWLQRALG
jgi:RNA polymerase sigma factor (TIGR02999 family)